MQEIIDEDLKSKKIACLCTACANLHEEKQYFDVDKIIGEINNGNYNKFLLYCENSNSSTKISDVLFPFYYLKSYEDRLQLARLSEEYEILPNIITIYISANYDKGSSIEQITKEIKAIFQNEKLDIFINTEPLKIFEKEISGIISKAEVVILTLESPIDYKQLTELKIIKEKAKIKSPKSLITIIPDTQFLTTNTNPVIENNIVIYKDELYSENVRRAITGYTIFDKSIENHRENMIAETNFTEIKKSQKINRPSFSNIKVKKTDDNKFDNPIEKIKKEIKRLIEEDRLASAFSYLTNFLLYTDEENQLINLISRFNSLKRERANGLITPKDHRIEINNIRNSFLLFVGQLEKIDFDSNKIKKEWFSENNVQNKLQEENYSKNTLNNSSANVGRDFHQGDNITNIYYNTDKSNPPL